MYRTRSKYTGVAVATVAATSVPTVVKPEPNWGFGFSAASSSSAAAAAAAAAHPPVALATTIPRSSRTAAVTAAARIKSESDTKYREPDSDHSSDTDGESTMTDEAPKSKRKSKPAAAAPRRVKAEPIDEKRESVGGSMVSAAASEQFVMTWMTEIFNRKPVALPPPPPSSAPPSPETPSDRSASTSPTDMDSPKSPDDTPIPAAAASPVKPKLKPGPKPASRTKPTKKRPIEVSGNYTRPAPAKPAAAAAKPNATAVLSAFANYNSATLSRMTALSTLSADAPMTPAETSTPAIKPEIPLPVRNSTAIVTPIKYKQTMEHAAAMTPVGTSDIARELKRRVPFERGVAPRSTSTMPASTDDSASSNVYVEDLVSTLKMLNIINPEISRIQKTYTQDGAAKGGVTPKAEPATPSASASASASAATTVPVASIASYAAAVASVEAMAATTPAAGTATTPMVTPLIFPVTPAFAAANEAMIRPNWAPTKVGPLTHTERLASVKLKVDYLHDRLMLYEAGPRPSFEDPTLTLAYPRCMFGTECAGMKRAIKGFHPPGSNAPNPNKAPSGVVVCAWMSPNEHSLFQRTGELPRELQTNVPGEADGAGRPCLLDIRIAVHLLHLKIQDEGGVGFQNILIQPFENKVDCQFGYNSSCCLKPAGGSEYNGLVLPIATYNHRCLTAKYDAKLSLWRICQREMEYPPPADAQQQLMDTRKEMDGPNFR